MAQPVPYSWAFTLCLSLFAVINAATDIVGAKARTVLCAVGLTSTIRPPEAQRAGAVSPHSGPRIASSACPSGPVMDAREPTAWGAGHHRPCTDSCSPGDWGDTSAVSAPTAWQRGSCWGDHGALGGAGALLASPSLSILSVPAMQCGHPTGWPSCGRGAPGPPSELTVSEDGAWVLHTCPLGPLSVARSSASLGTPAP